MKTEKRNGDKRFRIYQMTSRNFTNQKMKCLDGWGSLLQFIIQANLAAISLMKMEI